MSEPIPVFSSPEGKTDFIQAYQKVLDQWPVPFNEIIVPTSFGEAHVIASGPEGAQPVVLLHALLASAASWYRNVESLSRDFRVYAVDVIGEGNPSRPIKPIRSMDDFLSWFTELIDGLGIRTLYLVGNSYGGFTGAYYAMNMPERIRKLVIIGPAATIHPMRPFYFHMFIPKAVYGFLPWLPGKKKAIRESVTWMHKGLPVDPLWEPLFYSSMLNGGLINQVFPRVYTREEFARIKIPVLLILGEEDVIYNDDTAVVARAARELIPGVEVQLVPNAHHITALAQPEIVNQHLLRFFAG